MPITWKDEYSVNVKLVDNQHKQFIETLNSLYDSIASGKTRDTLETISDSLIEYGVFHFQTEEDYFDKFNYDGAEEHKRAHADFKVILTGLRKDLNDNHFEVSVKLVDFLEDWLVNHLHGLDKKYVKCFNDHGLV